MWPHLLHGMPAGQAVSRFGSGIFFFSFFFFVVVTNLHINLFIKLSPLLEEMYCSHCVQQKRPNENLLLARISRGRGPPHPYLYDVKSSFDLFIKPGLNSLLVAAIFFTSFRLNYAVSKRNLTLLKRQMERTTSKKHSTGKTVEIGEFLAKEFPLRSVVLKLSNKAWFLRQELSNVHCFNCRVLLRSYSFHLPLQKG